MKTIKNNKFFCWKKKRKFNNLIAYLFNNLFTTRYKHNNKHLLFLYYIYIFFILHVFIKLCNRNSILFSEISYFSLITSLRVISFKFSIYICCRIVADQILNNSFS